MQHAGPCNIIEHRRVVICVLACRSWAEALDLWKVMRKKQMLLQRAQ